MYIPTRSTLRRSPRIAAKRIQHSSTIEAVPSALRDKMWYVDQIRTRLEACDAAKTQVERLPIAIELATFLARECVPFITVHPQFFATTVAKFCSFKAQFPDALALIASCDTLLRALGVNVEHLNFTPAVAQVAAPVEEERPYMQYNYMQYVEEIRRQQDRPIALRKGRRVCAQNPAGFYKF